MKRIIIITICIAALIICIQESDKFLHFAAGAMIGIAPYGVALATMAGIGKEIYDMQVERHYPSVSDIIMTVFGGIFTTAILWKNELWRKEKEIEQ